MPKERKPLTPEQRQKLIAECDHPQLEYVGDPDPLTDLRCVSCPWQHSVDYPGVAL